MKRSKKLISVLLALAMLFAMTSAVASAEEKLEGVDSCEHMCHNDGWLVGFFWKIVKFVFRILDIRQYCDCGVTHY